VDIKIASASFTKLCPSPSRNKTLNVKPGPPLTSPSFCLLNRCNIYRMLTKSSYNKQRTFPSGEPNRDTVAQW
jgi:hypothetical protein